MVPTKLVPEVESQAAGAEWFMDYRNADGSIAEMCGNGVRVFARYLVDAGLADPGAFGVATRNGVRKVRVGATGDVQVDMGKPSVSGESRTVLNGREYRGLRVNVGNPHLACVITDPVTELDLSAQPSYDRRAFPEGVNIELINPIGDHSVSMRVYERGSGETRSCGTGAVATAVAAAHAAGRTEGVWSVRVLGGTLTVTLDAETSYLARPAELVATGDYHG